MTKLGNYLRRHEQPYTLRVPNGKGILEVRFYDGYVTIYSRQPGSRGFEQEIHITRKAWRKLLGDHRLDDVTGMMEGPSFDRYRAERVYYRAEAAHLQELREQKRAEGRRRRQRT